MPTFLLTEIHRKAEQVARILMAKHGLTNYSFSWMRAKRICGLCSYPRYNRCGVISLSHYYVANNSEADIVDTILHEIAHALSPGAKHGPAWQSTCVKIGARPQRLADSSVVMPKGNLVAECQCCGRIYRKHRLRSGWTYHCSYCGRLEGKLKYESKT
jgi:predicted SprT family Zn-dependent metalloprotease